MFAAIDALAEHGPALQRPLADTLTGSVVKNLKELRPGVASGKFPARHQAAFYISLTGRGRPARRVCADRWPHLARTSLAPRSPLPVVPS